jgi:hypothetical protein
VDGRVTGRASDSGGVVDRAIAGGDVVVDRSEGRSAAERSDVDGAVGREVDADVDGDSGRDAGGTGFGRGTDAEGGWRDSSAALASGAGGNTRCGAESNPGSEIGVGGRVDPAAAAPAARPDPDAAGRVVAATVRTGAGRGAAGANRKISSERPRKPKTTARKP